MRKYIYTSEERETIRQRLEDAIMGRPGPPEITVTVSNGCIEDVSNIVRGQSVVTRDIDEGSDGDAPLIVRRWYFDGSSEIIYEGEIENEKIPRAEGIDVL